MCRRGSDLNTTEDPISFTGVGLTNLTESAAGKRTMTITQHSISMVSEMSRSTTTGTVEVEEKAEGLWDRGWLNRPFVASFISGGNNIASKFIPLRRVLL